MIIKQTFMRSRETETSCHSLSFSLCPVPTRIPSSLKVTIFPGFYSTHFLVFLNSFPSKCACFYTLILLIKKSYIKFLNLSTVDLQYCASFRWTS